MRGKNAALLLSGMLAACTQASPPEVTTAPAPSPPRVAAAAPAPSRPAALAPASAPDTAGAQAARPASSPQPDHIVNIRGAGCQDLLRLSPDDRAAASMFYIGYQASRLRARTINVGRIPSIEAQAVTYCQENPRRTVADVFAEAFVRSRK